MNRPVITYLLIFIFLGALLFFLFNGRRPFGKNNSSFGIEGKTEITRIDFFHGEEKLFLEKYNGKWLINRKEETRKSAIIFLLRTLKEIKIKSPVSPDVFENEVIKKQIDPVKVNIYEKRRLIKSFFVYKTGSNIYGNILKMKASSKPFIVYIPGYEDNIGTQFIVNELFWKPNLVFNFLPSQISSIKFENISDTSSSFIITYRRNGFSLSDGKRDILGWDSLKVRRYITYYTSISFDSWAPDLTETEKRNIESGLPLYRIAVTKPNGEETAITIWEKWNRVNGEKKRDTDRVWAKTNLQADFFIMRYFDLDPIIKKRTYFFPE